MLVDVIVMPGILCDQNSGIGGVSEFSIGKSKLASSG